MTASERTKQLLANGLKELAATSPLRKIRVGELCERCGVDRRTFYYHFRDIYDLAAWIFEKTVITYYPSKSHVRPTREGLTRVLERFRKEGAFYRCALAEDSQNALGRYYVSRTVAMYSTVVQNIRGRERLTDQESFSITYHCIGALGMTRRWLFSEPERSAEEFAEYMIQSMPPVIRSLYETEQEEAK